jgi:hypothetical protein
MVKTKLYTPTKRFFLNKFFVRGYSFLLIKRASKKNYDAEKYKRSEELRKAEEGQTKSKSSEGIC